MNDETRRQIVALLAEEMEAYGDNLDALEGQILSSLREVGEGTLQAVTAAKKGATQAAGDRVRADGPHDSSATGPRRS